MYNRPVCNRLARSLKNRNTGIPGLMEVFTLLDCPPDPLHTSLIHDRLGWAPAPDPDGGGEGSTCATFTADHFGQDRQIQPAFGSKLFR